VGFIGGKTQTDLAAIDDLYLDGMVPFCFTSQVLILIVSQPLASRMKLTDLDSKAIRRRRARSLTTPTLRLAYIALILSVVSDTLLGSQPILKPLVEKDVPKVVQAIRQTQSRKVLCKLLTRVKVCLVSSFVFPALIDSAFLLLLDDRGPASSSPNYAFAWF